MKSSPFLLCAIGVSDVILPLTFSPACVTKCSVSVVIIPRSSVRVRMSSDLQSHSTHRTGPIESCARSSQSSMRRRGREPNGTKTRCVAGSDDNGAVEQGWRGVGARGTITNGAGSVFRAYVFGVGFGIALHLNVDKGSQTQRGGEFYAICTYLWRAPLAIRATRGRCRAPGTH